ncbi:MAG TPA: NAD(P)/FAD-dependent oxidoreductase [Tepidisphaeraceae bacterium]|nr:NAD(P)/FAD-dependent oxidoreductase [Tepidisphaeraceae bacterium]
MNDLLVIGAGPAGCVASILLARAGLPVTLIEQHRFPRDKVCGECLSAVGIDVLDRLRLSAPLQLLQPAPLQRTILFAPSGEVARLNLPRPMLGISRLMLDQFLLDAAIAAGVKILQPARCEGTGEQVRVRDLQTNQILELSPAYVLVADGKGSARPTGDFGIKSHFANVDSLRDAIELFGLRGHYGGIAPIERGQWNLAFSVPQARIQQHKNDLDGMMKQIFAENVALKEQMGPAHRTSDWLAAPLPRFGVNIRDTGVPPVRTSSMAGTAMSQARVIPIGNAAAAIEPIGGEGMGLAMCSAELAAERLITSIRAGTEFDATALRREYQQLWRRRSIGCRLAGMAVSSPIFCRAFFPFLGGADNVSGLAMCAMGKS